MTESATLREQLQKMADELRVKAHLAGMEAKEKWTELEPRLQAFEKKAEGAAGEFADELAQTGRKLKDDFGKLLDQVKAKVEST